MNDCFTLLPQSEVGGRISLERRTQCPLDFHWISRADHAHLWKNAKQPDVLASVMGGTEGGIAQSTTDADDDDRLSMVAEIDSNLFQTSCSDKGNDGVNNGSHSRHRKTCGYPDHICFRNSAVEEARRKSFLEGVEEPIADVAAEEDDPLVLFSSSDKLFGESISHIVVSTRKPGGRGSVRAVVLPSLSLVGRTPFRHTISALW